MTRDTLLDPRSEEKESGIEPFYECTGDVFSFIAVDEWPICGFSCRRLICGPNAIDVEIIPIWKLLVKEVISPVFCWDVG